MCMVAYRVHINTCTSLIRSQNPNPDLSNQISLKLDFAGFPPIPKKGYPGFHKLCVTSNVSNTSETGYLFSALFRNLVGHRQVKMACKKLSDEVLDCELSNLHPLLPNHSCFTDIENGLPFCCRLTQVVLVKRPLRVYVIV